MDQIVRWDVPIRAAWLRGVELEGLVAAKGKLSLDLLEENTDAKWRLRFNSVQAVRITSEECAASILARLETEGAFFEVKNSLWIDGLKAAGSAFLADARHFVVSCYDEVIEIVGTDPSFERLPSVHRPGRPGGSFS